MTDFFTSREAARRYDRFRPKVHHAVLDWLGRHCGSRRWRRGLDVACGTGDSTIPLLKVCDEVIGIDTSAAMLEFAQAKGLSTYQSSYDAFRPDEPFDLISTCMAFHWFDPVEAIRCYKAISAEESQWVIFNFAFAGHATSAEFNSWFRDRYLTRFPSPPRQRMASVVPRDDPEITCLGEDRGSLLIDFTPEQLVGYLSTQSNVERAVHDGADYDQICADLLAQIGTIASDGPFRYAFSYEIHQFRRSPGGHRTSALPRVAPDSLNAETHCEQVKFPQTRI